MLTYFPSKIANYRVMQSIPCKKCIEYVRSYEEQLKSRSIADEHILAELAWAKDKADWLDPLISKPDEYLDHYNKDTITQPKNSYCSSFSPPSQHSEYNPWAKPWWKK